MKQTVTAYADLEKEVFIKMNNEEKVLNGEIQPDTGCVCPDQIEAAISEEVGDACG